MGKEWEMRGKQQSGRARADDRWCSLGSSGEGRGMQMETSGSVQGRTKRAMER